MGEVVHPTLKLLEPLAGSRSIENSIKKNVGDATLTTSGASTNGQMCGDHAASIRRLCAYAPEHMLPHLGFPLTRYALGLLGVHVVPSQMEFPSASVRAECWETG